VEPRPSPAAEKDAATIARRERGEDGGKGTLIVIPAHNEEENIGSVLDELASLGLGHDVLVINDASTDGTEAVLRRRGQRSLRLSGNLGYGGAVQTGFKYALRHGYDFVVQMDGDCQHDPRSIPKLLEEVESGRADVALGSRFRGELRYTVPVFRRWGIALFRAVVGSLTGLPITDPTSGFQAMNRKVLAFFAGDNYPLDYPDSDVLLALHYAGFRIREVPVVMRPRERGQSIHGGWKTVYYLAKMLLAIPMVLLRHYRRPRRKA
jgi:glycosyltransferase involved in cell wall biosynthesis